MTAKYIFVSKSFICRIYFIFMWGVHIGYSSSKFCVILPSTNVALSQAS